MSQVATLSVIEEQVLALSEKDRAHLAGILLHSLPGVLEDDDDDGIEEASRRLAEFEADPTVGMTLSELQAALRE